MKMTSNPRFCLHILVIKPYNTQNTEQNVIHFQTSSNQGEIMTHCQWHCHLITKNVFPLHSQLTNHNSQIEIRISLFANRMRYIVQVRISLANVLKRMQKQKAAFDFINAVEMGLAKYSKILYCCLYEDITSLIAYLIDY